MSSLGEEPTSSLSQRPLHRFQEEDPEDLTREHVGKTVVEMPGVYSTSMLSEGWEYIALLEIQDILRQFDGRREVWLSHGFMMFFPSSICRQGLREATGSTCWLPNTFQRNLVAEADDPGRPSIGSRFSKHCQRDPIYIPVEWQFIKEELSSNMCGTAPRVNSPTLFQRLRLGPC